MDLLLTWVRGCCGARWAVLLIVLAMEVGQVRGADPDWRVRNPGDYPACISGFASNGGNQFLAVGEQGLMLANHTENYGGDLDNWRPADSKVSVWLRGVAWSRQLWVVVGDGGTILISTNRLDWQTVNAGVVADLLAVGEAGGTWVAVGEDGLVLQSRDAVNWTRIGGSGVAPGIRWRSIAGSQSGTFAIGGDQGWVGSLSNGNLSVRRLATTSDVVAMAAGRGSVRGWLAGSGRRLFSSSDGQTWTQTNEMPEVITAIWHSTVDWTLVGLNGMVRASRDGMTWKEVIYDSSPIQPRADLWSVSYGNGTWLMGGSQGALVAGLNSAHNRGFAVRSTELQGESLRDDFHALGQGGSSWVLLGNMKRVMRGGLPINAAWPVPSSISHTDHLGRPRIALSIATHPSVWMAVGLDGYISRSTDGGRSFAEVLDSGTSANLHVVRQSDGLFVAAGERGVVRVFRLGQSVPTWGNVRFGFPVDHVTWLSLAHARGLWMLIGSGGVTAVSTNGMDWNPGPMLPEPVELYSLHGDQDSWVAVGERGSIYVRSDVGPWERVVSPTGADLKYVTFANEQWVACGEEGTLLVAAHPRRWTPVRVPVPVVITAMRFIQDHWVLGGGGGLGLIHRGAIPVSFGLPSDATLGVRWSQHTPGRFVLFWKAAGAEDDFLESSGSPASGRWRPIDQQAERQGAEMQVVLPVQTGAAAYYRLRR